MLSASLDSAVSAAVRALLLRSRDRDARNFALASNVEAMMNRAFVAVALIVVVADCSSGSRRAQPAPTTRVSPTSKVSPTSRIASPSACSAVSGGARERPFGYVAGTLRMVGGPPPGLDRPVAGSVVAVAASGARCSAAVGADGSFGMQLEPNLYTFTGHSPTFGNGKYDCSAERSVDVIARLDISQAPPPFVKVACSVD